MLSNLGEVACCVSFWYVTLVVKHDKMSCLCRVDRVIKCVLLLISMEHFFLFQFDPDRLLVVIGQESLCSWIHIKADNKTIEKDI